MKNIGLLWDVENVTPPSGLNYVQSIVEAVCEGDSLSYAMAFGDWNNTKIKDIASEMAANNFELIHTPHAGKKNSADMALVAHGVELIFQYPDIERFVLISGDGDFRPLLLTQKKHGKETWVVCDVNNSASEDLVNMADRSLDYRDIIKVTENLDEPQDNEVHTTGTGLSKETAFELLEETVGLMTQKKKKTASGGVKSYMKLLNPQFDEKTLGYNSWLAFVQDAQHATKVTYKNNSFVISGKNTSTIPKVFRILIAALPDNGQWTTFSAIAQQLNFKGSGYKQFKDMALDAEKRGYVTTKNSGTNWSLRRSVNA